MTRAPYIESGETTLCTGCAACAYACPTDAIAMTEDACGFVYPVVDEGRCVSCGKCLKACHMAAPDQLKSESASRAYGAYVTDREQLSRSASGGVATALSLHTLKGGGVAYGCVADREDVRHERLSTFKEAERSRGSKYVQSDISGVFPKLSDDLKAGAQVLFVGTPCQCAALRRLFGNPRNLLLVDLVCEGVPNRRMYADFLSDLERERGERVTDFRFRDKRGGWSTKNAVVVGEGGRPLDRQPHSYYYYYWLFANALILRDSCYACPYACRERVSDITVGDFWGVESAGLGYGLEELRDGISCVLTSSERGQLMLDNLMPDIDVKPCSLELVTRSNSCLSRPSSCNAVTRREVLDAYASDRAVGMRRAYREMFGPLARLKAVISTRLPLAIRVALKKVAAHNV